MFRVEGGGNYRHLASRESMNPIVGGFTIADMRRVATVSFYSKSQVLSVISCYVCNWNVNVLISRS